MIGKTVSHYKIIEKLGEGGMGEVYLAEDLKLERKVAIKFLPQHLTKDKDNVERFEREAKAAASLNHPNIVTIHEIAEENDQIFIVMENVEGKSLRDIISEYKMGIDKIIDIITQISVGLSQAHKAGIVHRDIKPENIIIDKDARVKILDFGLAKLRGVTNLTKESSTLGTIHYMSPEQLRGEEVDQRSDIWSLGVVFYEMLAGDVPFKGDYDQAVAYSIQSEEFDPISSIASDHHEILNKFLAKKPENRYQNLREFTDALGEDKGSNMARRSIKSHRYIVYPLSIMALLVFGYFLITEMDFDVSKDSSTEWENSIGVLPIDDLSSEKDQEWFCDGMTEQIISDLSRFPLKVIGRKSMMKYKNTDKSISEIGEELNIAYVLESSLRKFGDRIRFSAKLISTKDDFQVWSENYDKNYSDLLALQDEVSELIAKSLLPKISGEESERIKQNKPKNLEAWEYYSRGVYFHKMFSADINRIDHFNKSEKMLKRAIELEPGYVTAYAEIADLYNTYYATSEEEEQIYLNLQKKYINAGFSIDSNSADMYGVNGWFHYAKEDFQGTYENFKKSILIKPNPRAYYGLSVFYRVIGLYRLSIKFSTKAIELDPFYPSFYIGRSLCHYNNCNVKQAELDILKALDFDPNSSIALRLYTVYLIDTDRITEGKEVINKLVELYPDLERKNQLKSVIDANSVIFLRSLIYALTGEKEKAFENYPDGHLRIYTALNMVEETIDSWQKDIDFDENSEKSYYLHLRNSHKYDFLRSDPRFQEILEKHKEIYEKNLEKYGDIDI